MRRPRARPIRPAVMVAGREMRWVMSRGSRLVKRRTAISERKTMPVMVRSTRDVWRRVLVGD
jgi:hypothetical protein